MTDNIIQDNSVETEVSNSKYSFKPALAKSNSQLMWQNQIPAIGVLKKFGYEFTHFIKEAAKISPEMPFVTEEKFKAATLNSEITHAANTSSHTRDETNSQLRFHTKRKSEEREPQFIPKRPTLTSRGSVIKDSTSKIPSQYKSKETSRIARENFDVAQNNDVMFRGHTLKLKNSQIAIKDGDKSIANNSALNTIEEAKKFPKKIAARKEWSTPVRQEIFTYAFLLFFKLEQK